MQEPTQSIADVIHDLWGVDIKKSSVDTEIKVSIKELIHFGSKITDNEKSKDKESSDLAYFFQQLIDSLPDYIYFKDDKSRFVFCNPAHIEHLGLTHLSQAVGKTDLDFFQKRFAKQKLEDELKIIRSGRGWYFREEHHRKQGGEEIWALTTKLPLYNKTGEICGTFGISRDITEKKHTEIELERQRRLLNTIIQILPCRLFVRDTNGRFLLINEEYRKQLKLKRTEDVIGKTLKECFPSDDTDSVEQEDKEVLENDLTIVNKVGYDTSLLTNKCWITTSKVPLKSRKGKIEGIVGITMDISEQKKAEQKAQAAFTALSHRSKQMESELDIARNLQERLMSEGFKKDHSFKAEGKQWALSAGYIYQPSHHLAGDFFHLIPISKSKVGILVCDVMGHGVKAALVTMLIRGILIEANPFVEKPNLVLEHINNRLAEFAQDPQFPRFTTAIYIVLDLNRGGIRYANAGHPNPVFIKNQSSIVFDTEEKIGCALGLIPEETYTLNEIEMKDVDRFALFSDGITETTNVDGDYFGNDKISKALIHSADTNILNEMNAFELTLKRFAGSDHFADDICLLVFDLMAK